MQDSRGEYTERKRRQMNEHRQLCREIWSQAERIASPLVAAHDRELQVAKDKLRVAYAQLESLERASEESFRAQRETFERIEDELRGLLEAASRRWKARAKPN